MTSFLYAIPITSSSPSAWITSNCLRNSGIWQEVEDFNNEYLVLHDSQEIQKLFQVVQVKKNNMSGMFGGMFGRMLKSPFPFGDYINWRRFCNIRFPFSVLLPRPSVQKWLLRLFLRVCVFQHHPPNFLRIINVQTHDFVPQFTCDPTANACTLF